MISIHGPPCVREMKEFQENSCCHKRTMLVNNELTDENLIFESFIGFGSVT